MKCPECHHTANIGDRVNDTGIIGHTMEATGTPSAFWKIGYLFF
jgi:hypothetical protein